MIIAIGLYQRFTALDSIGPYEVFTYLPRYLALTIAGTIAGPEVAQAIQLSIEYDPHPPFDTGAQSKALKPIYDLATAAVGRMHDCHMNTLVGE